MFVLGLLKDPDWTAWGQRPRDNNTTNRDDAAKRLMSAVVRMQSCLDSIAVLDNNLRPESDRVAFDRVSFWATDLCLQGARPLQVYLRNAVSASRPRDECFLTFNSVANFWKHYYPSLLEPQDHCPHRDFFLRITARDKSGALFEGTSGPILQDLLLPALRVALSLVFVYAGSLNVPEDSMPVMHADVSLAKTTQEI